ncbi:restriction endonuclease subunit S [Calothrix sp. FACHB-1219]|uniref:restriction endonuclease subunit S n=1 Tax=unclassified Calothrix TaxID=2619626 RepID=UPI001682F115|nr:MULTISPECIES: restriction endonuclease subunit S [unclassified Calothrix]MBD2206883.1 restriction endonuclease subunit S [Calothrix sp. FACHB-168]MBD2221501.1 restriction endonuclease subunit S [Calothrix sp. FACHB-1219]
MVSKDWQSAKLGDVLLICRGGAWGEDCDQPNVGVLRANNITENFRLSFDGVAWRKIPDQQLASLRLENGDIILTKSNSIGRVGSCALFHQPDDDRNYIAANFCQMLRFNQEIINAEYAYYWLISPDVQQAIKAKATGTSESLQNISREKINQIDIFFPSLDQQKQLAARIKECIEKVDEIYQLHKDNRKEIGKLKCSLVLGKQRSERNWIEINELVSWIQNTESVKENEIYHFVGTKSFGKGLFHSATRTTQDFKYQNLRRLRHRDFIYPKLMAWEGAFGMVPEEFDGFVVSPEFVVFRTKDDIICPEVLDTYFRSPICLEDVRNASTGSNKRRRRLNPQAFLKLKMPVPPHDVQEQLKKVYEFEAKAAESWKDLPETLEKIRQGILKKAFAGDL